VLREVLQQEQVLLEEVVGVDIQADAGAQCRPAGVEQLVQYAVLPGGTPAAATSYD
jgi:hypothetical protein